MVRRFLWHTLLLLMGFYHASGQESGPFNLEECINYALDNSYLITEQEIERSERDTGYKASKTAFLPKIDAYINYFQYLSDFPTYIFPENEGNILSGGNSTGPYPVGLGLPYNLSGGLTIDQVLFDKKFFMADDYAENLDKINRLKESLSKEDIIYNVAITYYKLSSLQNNRALIDYNLRRLNRIERMLQSQIDNGFAREIDRGRITIQRAKIASGQEDLESGILKLRNYLKFLMGMPIDQEMGIQSDSITLREGWDQMVDTLEIRSKQLELLSVQEEMNELQRSSTSADYYPRLSAFASFQAQAQRDAFNFFSGGEDWFLINVLGVKLDIPIMNGGDKRRKMEMTEVEASRIALNKEKLQENLRMQYESNYHELLASIKKVKYAEENEQVSADLYIHTEKLFAEGLVQLPDLLDAEALHEEMQIDNLKALFEYKQAEINFMKAAGTLLSFTDISN